MAAPAGLTSALAISRPRVWLGILCLGGGLLGHILAAQAIGGSYVAYRDHVGGFVLLALVSGVIVWALGQRFWKGRHDTTLLIVGVVQALLGLVVYVNRFHIL